MNADTILLFPLKQSEQVKKNMSNVHGVLKVSITESGWAKTHLIGKTTLNIRYRYILHPITAINQKITFPTPFG